MDTKDVIVNLTTRNLELEQEVAELERKLEIMNESNGNLELWLKNICTAIDWSGHYANLASVVKSKLGN